MRRSKGMRPERDLEEGEHHAEPPTNISRARVSIVYAFQEWARSGSAESAKRVLPLLQEQASRSTMRRQTLWTSFEHADPGSAHTRLRRAMQRRAPRRAPDPVFVQRGHVEFDDRGAHSQVKGVVSTNVVACVYADFLYHDLQEDLGPRRGAVL
jgi:hypothetical protein